MDRRGFVSGISALAATAGAGVGVSNFVEAREAAAAKVRAAGLAMVAGMPASAVDTPMTPDASLVDIGYLPHDALASHGVEGMRAQGYGAKQGAYAVPAAGARYDVNLVGLRRVRPQPALKSLDIVARFAIDDPPSFASFLAWSHLDAKVPKTSSPIVFPVLTPDRAALELNYVLVPVNLGKGGAPPPVAGKLYLPIGGTGLAPGIYVMTTPSASTGTTPNLQDFSYSGNPDAPLKTRSGAPLDFDHFVFAIRTRTS